MSLKRAALKGVKWTTASAVGCAMLQVLQLAVLTHILQPDVFGLMALAMVGVGFAQSFADMGISEAIIHKQDITHQQLSTLYWVNILAGVFMAGAVVAAAPLVAWFYDDGRLIGVMALISLTFIIQSLGQQWFILMQKELQFNTLAKIEIISKLIALLVSVGLALHGFGVYALVYGAIADTAFKAVACVWTGRHAHMPKAVFDLKSVKPLLTFGYFTMAERGLNYFNGQVDTLIIGKIFGMEMLGLYGVAKRLVLRPAQLINPIVNRVALPVLAKVQHDAGALQRIYLKIIRAIAMVNFPIHAAMYLLAPLVVPLLLGSSWHVAVPYVQVLALYAALRAIGNPIGSLILATGKYKRGFYWNLAMFILTAPVIYIGSFYGLLGVCYSLLGFGLLMLLPNWYFLVKPCCGAPFMAYHKQLFVPFVYAAIFAAALFGGLSLAGGSLVAAAGVLILVSGLLLGVYCVYDKTLLDFLRPNKTA